MAGTKDLKHQYVQLKDLRVHYVEEGHGETVFLMHGWPGFWFDWHLNIPIIAEHFRVIAPDMRGYGDTDKPDLPPEKGYTLNMAVKDLVELMDQLGIEKAYFVGHDYSSMVLHKFVRRHPERVNRLMLFNPLMPGCEGRYLSPGHFPESWYSQFHQLPMSDQLVGASAQNIEIYFRHFLSHWSHNKSLFTDEEIKIYVENFLKKGNVVGGFNWYRANLSIHSQPWDPIDRTISEIETRVLWGMSDPVVPVTWSDLVPLWYKNYTYKVIPNCGHFVGREAHELVNKEIIDFFSKK